jgi:VCBS repeat-containing protein
VTLAAVACGGDHLTLPNQGVPAKVEKIAGDGQEAPAGTAVAPTPSVKVTDATGSPVSNVAVTFQVSGGGGSVTPASATTNATGVATVATWTLGSTPGPNQLTATVAGSDINGNPALFAATGVVGNGNKLAFLVQPTSTTVRQPITPPVQVQVRDAANNPVTSATNPITIVLAANPGGATLSGTTTVNAVNGVATFSNLSLNKGGNGYTLTAFGSSLVAATSAAFNVGNRAPNAGNDSYNTNEDTPLTVPAPGVLANDNDPDGDPITAVKLTDPAHGTVSLAANGSFTYTPQANFFGSDAFTYAANDGSTNSTAATVSITVNAVNDPPSFTKGPDQAATAGSPQVVVTGWATAISPGPNESTQTVSFDVSNDHPEVFLGAGGQPAVDANGTLTFQANFVVLVQTVATVTVTAHDNGGTGNGGQDTSAPQQFTITISP